MPDAAARRRGAAGNESNHGLPAPALGLIGDELGGIFLGRAADLPDHDDRLGGLVGQEHFQHLDELGALHRIAADADGGGLAKALACGLEYRLVSERAGTRHDPYLAGFEDVARHDADLAFTRRHHAGAVRADQPRFSAGERALDLDHVEHGYAFGDADDERDRGLARLADRIGGARRRNIDHARVAAGLLLRLGHGVEHRQTEMCAAAFARRGPADHPGAVGDSLLGMEGAVLAGEALADDLGVLVNQDGHRRLRLNVHVAYRTVSSALSVESSATHT